MRRLAVVARLALVALVATAAASCGNGTDCAKSADIQVTVAPSGDVAVGEIAKLHVMLSVADGPVRALDIWPDHTITSSSAFILRPDPAPSDKYDVSLTVQAFNGSNALVAIGAESIQAVSIGCNRMTVHLAAVPVDMTPPNVDMSFPPGSDLAGLMPPPDMAGCVGGTPDEDSDGRANFCDLCPDDYDPAPTDGDADGLPDVCDPDPTSAGSMNKLLYFDPMDTATGHWSTPNNLIANSYLTLDTMQQQRLTSNNGVDMLPTNVRVQGHIFLKGIYGGTPFSDAGIFVGTNANPAATTANGVLCTLHYHPSSTSDSLDIYPVTNGVLGTPASVPTSFNPAMYRMRVTQRSTGWTCETVANGIPTATVTLVKPTAGPLFVALWAEYMEAHFHAVVAESALP